MVEQSPEMGRDDHALREWHGRRIRGSADGASRELRDVLLSGVNDVPRRTRLPETSTEDDHDSEDDLEREPAYPGDKESCRPEDLSRRQLWFSNARSGRHAVCPCFMSKCGSCEPGSSRKGGYSRVMNAA